MGSPIVKHGGRSAVLALVLLAVPAAGASQRLVVIVEDDASGQRLQGATVCVGTTANRAQLGTDETNLNGRAAFDGLPAGTWKVTVNLEGYLDYLTPDEQRCGVVAARTHRSRRSRSTALASLNFRRLALP